MRVEKIIINPGHPLYAVCRRYCLESRFLYNCANYIIRQAFIKEKKIIGWRDVDKQFKTENQEHYRGMPGSASAQLTVMMLGRDWKSFFQANRQYKNHPEKFKGRPKLPSYCKSLKTLVVQRNGFKVEDSILTMTGIGQIKIRCVQNQPFNEKADKAVLKEVRIVPLGNAFCLQLAYKEVVTKDSRTKELREDCYLGIDFGVTNLATLVAVGKDLLLRPILCKGGRVKSVNQLYNKTCASLKSEGKGKHIKAKVRKRYSQLDDYLHKLSHFICEYCLDNGIGVICLGRNKQWKDSINLGKKNNQKFVQIPHQKLINLIRYKAESVGITVLETEESYTSKASALDGDEIPSFSDNQKHRFSGKRVKRGLYKTAQGRLLNADVNGALNIIRKAVGNEIIDDRIKGLGVSGIVYMPEVVVINNTAASKISGDLTSPAERSSTYIL